jgi:thiamine kinase-like enzyme
MRPDELESTAMRYVPGEGSLEIHRLGAGLVNETYRVERDGRSYAMRTAANPQQLGVDREWEARVLESAAAAGLAPAPVYCDPLRGVLISQWVPGRSWLAAELRRPLNIARMAGLIRKIHGLSLPAPPRIMTPAQWIAHYSGALQRTGAADHAALRASAAAQLSALAALPSAGPVLCHSDLHTLNLVDRNPTEGLGGALVLLDWEYAHASDPLWDLAGWSANTDLEHELQQELLAQYLGRAPAPDERLRLQRLAWLYDYVCLLWSELYLKLQGGAGKAGSADGVAARALLLAARLMHPSSRRD